MEYGSTRETTPIELAILSARAAMEMNNKRLGNKPVSYEYSEKLVHQIGLIREQLVQGIVADLSNLSNKTPLYSRD